VGRYGSSEDWIPVLGKRILKLHIKEFTTKDLPPENLGRGFGVKLLEGTNNWPAIMKALDAIGYDGWGISEQPGNQSRDAAALKDLSERMDKIFAI
jgi:hexulose-6-phosphate isomerase